MSRYTFSLFSLIACYRGPFAQFRTFRNAPFQKALVAPQLCRVSMAMATSRQTHWNPAPFLTILLILRKTALVIAIATIITPSSSSNAPSPPHICFAFLPFDPPPRTPRPPSSFVSQTTKSTSNAVHWTTAATLLNSSLILLGWMRRIGMQMPVWY